MASLPAPDPPADSARPPSRTPSSHSGGSDIDVDALTAPDTRAASEPPSTDPHAAAPSPVPAARFGGVDGHGYGMGGDPPSIVETHASGGGFTPRFAPTSTRPANVPSPDDDTNYFGPDHETASDYGSVPSSNLGADTDAATIQQMVEKTVREILRQQNRGMGEGSGHGRAWDMDGSQGGGVDRVTGGTHSTTTQFRTPTPRPEPTPNTAPAPATSNTTQYRYHSTNPKALSYYSKDIATVEQCSFASDNVSIQKLAKQMKEAKGGGEPATSVDHE